MPKLTIEIDYPEVESAKPVLFRAFVDDQVLHNIHQLQLNVGPLSNAPTLMVSVTHEDSLEGANPDLRSRLRHNRELLESLGPLVLQTFNDGQSIRSASVERQSAWQLIKDETTPKGD